MKKIIEQLTTKNNFAIFTHVSPDGDAVGSLLALTYILKKMGKNVDAYTADEIPHRLQFMKNDAEVDVFPDVSDKKYDFCIALDCGDHKRLGRYEAMFDSASETMNIDHHVTNPNFADYNLVYPTASSTGEILFEIFEEMGVFDPISASLVYGSIASDTGCFAFGNTLPKTHEFAGKLITYKADYVRYNKLLFSTNTKSAISARAYASSNLEYYFSDKVCLFTLSQADLKRIGATKEDSEGLIDIPRSVEGVEVAMMLRETETGDTKVSIRATEILDAAEFVKQFNGGGHVRAAGCTLEHDLNASKSIILKALEEFF